MAIVLHHYPGNASMTPHIVLREIGVPFELALVDRDAGAHKSPAYLKLNPNGLIPVLQDGDLVLYETGAIVLHLADTHPDAQLAPPMGSAERGRFYTWLMWLGNTVQSMMIHYFYPDRMVAPGHAAGAAEVRAAAEARIAEVMDQIDAHLATTGAWMAGDRYTVLDPYTFMLGRWTRGMARPARERPHLGPYLARMLDRPAVQAALAAEGLSAPYV